MGQPRDCGSGFNVVHSVLHQPVEDLDEGQDREHGHEIDIELVAKDGHGQAGLHDCLADSVVDALYLGLPQCPQEDLQSRHCQNKDVSTQASKYFRRLSLLIGPLAEECFKQRVQHLSEEEVDAQGSGERKVSQDGDGNLGSGQVVD